MKEKDMKDNNWKDITDNCGREEGELRRRVYGTD